MCKCNDPTGTVGRLIGPGPDFITSSPRNDSVLPATPPTPDDASSSSTRSSIVSRHSESGSGQICSQRSTKFSSKRSASRSIASSSIDATGQGRTVSKSIQCPDSSAIQ
uniref:Uncharacterized protein n=1 Tax=Anopheles culicifacies TaxID=139723 RepID=A0A182MTW7_9DIPT